MALKTYTSATIRGITYNKGDKFTCYYSAKGNGGSEGNGGSAAALTKGATYYFLGYVVAADSGSTVKYPYKIGSSSDTVRGFYKEEVFPYATYKVTYNANGGSNAPAAQNKTYGTALTLSSAKPTRTGYTFKGWNTKANGTGTNYAAGASYTINAAITLYAVWTANTYTISYDANGGDVAPGKQTKKHGEALTLSSAKPTRTNYTFKGWGTSATTKTVSYAAGASYTNNADITLYAIWELSYTKPRVSNLKIDRCDSSGNWQDGGSDILVEFDYELDKNETPTILFSWKVSTDTVWINTVSLNDNNADFHIQTGTYSSSYAGTIDPEKTYTWELVIKDSGGDRTLNGTISSLKLAIDIMPPDVIDTHGNYGDFGVAVGKVAEERGVFDVGLSSKFNKPVYGKALGMDRLPAIPSNSDFNNYLEPGCYAVQSNAIADTIAHIPINRAGRLEVWSATGEGVRFEQWSYLRQRFIPYNSSNATWERELTRGENNVWNYYDWWKSSLTPDASEKVYSKAAMSINLSANTVLGAVNTYTKIPFNKVTLSTNSRLTLESNSIRIGANIQYVKVSGQVLVSPGSTSSLRHMRIQKVSGGTTSSVAWNTIYITASHHTMFVFTPLIVSVKEGDLLNMVFYTGNESDSISSGSAANGWQTYLTVEEL